MPQAKALMIHLWDKLKGYVKKAFTIILASTIVIWFLQSFTFDWKYIEQADPNEIANNTYEVYIENDDNKLKIESLDESYLEDGEVVISLEDLVNEYAENEDEAYEVVLDEIFTQALADYQEKINEPGYKDSSDSILAGFGKLITPIFTPLGFGSQLNENGWIYGVSAVTGLIAKENVVATFTVLAESISSSSISDAKSFQNLYLMSLDDEGVSSTISTANATGISGNGFKGWPILIAFIVFNMTTIPCFAAIATAKGELGKKKFIYTILFWLAVSFIAGSITYLVLSLWWLSFIFVGLFTLACFCIHFINKKRDLAGKEVIS